MFRVATIAAFLLVTASAVSAADERAESRGFRLAATAAAATGGVECIAPAGAAAVGYRFSRHAGMEVEIATVPGVTPHGSATQHHSAAASFGSTRRVVVASANLRGELPTRVRWLLPYVLGGIGIANVRTRGLVAATENDLAVAAGGGIDFKAFRNLWIDVGLRYQRVLGTTEDFNVTRFGIGLSYRF